MKRNFLFAVKVLLVLVLVSIPIVIADVLPDTVGTSTNASWSVTNKTGTRYIYSVFVKGTFDGTNQCQFTLTQNGGTFLAVKTATAPTNTFSYMDGTQPLKWDDNAVITFTVSCATNGSTTNLYVIGTTSTKKE